MCWQLVGYEELLMTQNVIKTFVAVPAENVDTLSVKLTKLNKKLVRGGLMPVTMKVTNRRIVKIDGGMIDAVDVEINGSAEMIEGDWTFIGRIDIEDGAVYTVAAPGREIPSKYREHPSDCEHCRINRYRAMTYVVQSKLDGTMKQVGSTCLADFFGFDPSQMRAYASMVGTLNDMDGDEGVFGRGRGVRMFETQEILATALAVIERDGYMSVKKAEEEYGDKDMATSFTVRTIFGGNVKDAPTPTAEMFDTASKMIDRVQTYLAKKSTFEYGLNDFETNLVTVLGQGYASEKRFGTVVAVYGVNAMLDRQEAAQKASANSKFVGKVGEMLTIDVEITSVLSMMSDFGPSWLVQSLDGSGNIVKFFTTKNTFMKGPAKVRGSVKKHETYKGVNATVLNRVKAL
jgi:hypothetical protein